MHENSIVSSAPASFKCLCRTDLEPQLWWFRSAPPRSCGRNLSAKSVDARYSSLGAAFFCPACGHNSAETTCSQTMETVRKSLAALPAIREAVQKIGGPDAAENTARQIL